MQDLQPTSLTTTQTKEFLSGTIARRFLIGERLGKGGMGEVYRAEDTKLKRIVALKRLAPHLRADPLYRRRFQEEAQRVSRFSDPHIASVYDVLEDRGEIFLVMEYRRPDPARAAATCNNAGRVSGYRHSVCAGAHRGSRARNCPLRYQT